VNFATTHVGVGVDLGGGLAGKPNELPRVQGSHHHLPGLLYGPERLGRARVVPVLHGLDLPENLLRYPRWLKEPEK
jgi:hypothetical protein